MSIKKSFGGATIRKPGAYSTSQQSASGGQNPASTGILFLLGEADTGVPGSIGGIAKYSAAQLGQLINDFTHGPIVDCARMAANPSKTSGVGGFDTVLVWKTNASTQASLQLKASSQNIFQLLAAKYGVAGNSIYASLANGTSSSTQRIITLQDQKNNITETLPQNAAIAQLSVQYVGTGTACTVTISGASASALTLTTTCTGATTDNVNLALGSMTMQQVVAALNAANGGGKYNAVLLNTQSGTVTPASDLDALTAQDIKTSVTSLYRLQQELVDLVNANSKLCTATKNGWGNPGIPAALSSTPLAGGARGASANTDFSTGLSKSFGVDYNVALPCISQDATADITAGLTDSASSYTIASVLAAVESHIRLRAQVKNRKEAQYNCGFRSSTKAAVYTQANSLNSEYGQLSLMDCLIVDETGTLAWKQPHVMASMVAGMRCGVPVGTPLTHKFLNCSGIGHDVEPTTGIAAGHFHATVDYDNAIDNGVTFAEQNSGGFRIVVDNTTYGKDGSFVFNRGSVMQASLYIAQTLRQTAESVFVGNKVSNGMASSIKNILAKTLKDLNDANITTASSDGAPLGYVEKTFSVTIQGNTASVSVEVKPVQGLDFVLISFTLGDIQQSA